MAAPKPTAAMTVELQLRLSDQSRKFLEEKADGKIGEKMSSWVSFWLDAQARGGVMVTPEDSQYIARIAGKALTTSAEITKAVEAAYDREDGAACFKIQIDPSFLTPLKEIASQQGRASVNEMLQDFVNDVITEVYGYNLKPDRTLRMTNQQFEEAKRITGKDNPFAADLIDALQRLEATARAKAA